MSKGVIVQVWDDDAMPTCTVTGVRADAIMDGHSTAKRMNVSRMYEQAINATSRETSANVRRMVGISNPYDRQDVIPTLSKPQVEELWSYITRYYEIVSPKMYDLINSAQYNTGFEARRKEVEEVIRDGIYIWEPTDNPVDPHDSMMTMRKEYPVPIHPVRYRDREGRWIVTQQPIMIGALYCIVLEKTGVDCSAVASARLNHFGIPSKLTKRAKFALPVRPVPVRGMGESETRLASATVGGEIVADLLEMSSSPATHKNVEENIMRAERPTAIKRVIDRKVVPEGGARINELVKHQLRCMGIEFYMVSAVERKPKIYHEVK